MIIMNTSLCNQQSCCSKCSKKNNIKNKLSFINKQTIKEGLKMGLILIPINLTFGKWLNSKFIDSSNPIIGESIRTLIYALSVHLFFEGTGINDKYVNSSYARDKANERQSMTSFLAPSYDSNKRQMDEKDAVLFHYLNSYT